MPQSPQKNVTHDANYSALKTKKKIIYKMYTKQKQKMLVLFFFFFIS